MSDRYNQLQALSTGYDNLGRPGFHQVDSMRARGGDQSQLAGYDRMAEARDDFQQSPVRALAKGVLAAPYEATKGLAMNGGIAGAPARYLLNNVGPAIGAPELAIDQTTSPASLNNPMSYWLGITKALEERWGDR